MGKFGRLLDQLDVDHLPLGHLLATRRHQNILRNPPVFRHHDQHTVLVQHPADDTPVGTIENLDDLAFRPATTVSADNPGDDPVPVKHFAHFLGTQEHIRLTVIADHKAKAVRVACHPSFEQVSLVGQDIGAATVLE